MPPDALAYNPNWTYVRSHTTSPPNLRATTGRDTACGAPQRGALDLTYSASYRAVDCHVPAVHILPAPTTSHKPCGHLPPDALIYDPQWAVVRPRSASPPSMHKMTGRRDLLSGRGAPPAGSYDVCYTQLDRAVPVVAIGALESRESRARRDLGGSPASVDHSYDVRDGLVRPRPPSPPVFSKLTGRRASAGDVRAYDLAYAPHYTQVDAHVAVATIKPPRETGHDRERATTDRFHDSSPLSTLTSSYPHPSSLIWGNGERFRARDLHSSPQIFPSLRRGCG